jgi:heme exporter protein D
MLNWGDVPAWLAAIGTVLALGVSVAFSLAAIRKANHETEVARERERAADLRAQEQAERAQAEQIPRGTLAAGLFRTRSAW